jgi:hypothetical protein
MDGRALVTIHSHRHSGEQPLESRRVRHALAGSNTRAMMFDGRDLCAIILTAMILISASLGYSGEFYSW